MTHEITADGTTIMRQGHMTADLYLMNAIEDIDKWMGEGSAKKYPQIVAAYMQAAATDAGSTIIAQQIRAGLDEVAEAIITAADNSSSIEAITDAIADHGKKLDNSEALAHSIYDVAKSLQNISEMLDMHCCGRPDPQNQTDEAA